MTYRLWPAFIGMMLMRCSVIDPNTTTILGCEAGKNMSLYGSGVARCNDIYLLSENCMIMQRYSVEHDRFTDIPLSGIDSKAHLTGVAGYHGMLYAINGGSSVIYRIDTAGDVRSTLRLALPAGVRRKARWGIAIDTTNNLLHVMRPLPSLLKIIAVTTFVIEVDDSGDIRQLRRSGEEVRVKRSLLQALLTRRFNYTDVTYDNSLKRLVFLRAVGNRIAVDEMEVNRYTGVLIPGLFRKVCDISLKSCRCRGYSARVEGFYAEGSAYYLVTNKRFRSDCGADQERKGLFVRVDVR